TPVCYRNTSAPAEVMQGAPGGWDGQSFESFCTAMDAVRAMPPDAIAEVRASLAERFNWPAIAQATLAVYRELAEPSPDARVRVLATALDAVGYGGVIHRLRTWRAARGPTGASSVVAANVHVVTECALRKPYRADVADADLVVPDGMPLVWAIRWFGTRLRTRCYGPELMVRTLAAFQSDGARHFLYGSTPETLAKLQQSIARRWPSAIVAGALSPSFGELDDAEEQRNIAIINAARPDFVWLAMGCPKQENWMHRYRRDLQAAAVLGVGAAFDFIAGTVPQAPPWLQRLGLEWALRLAAEPRRLWRRYLIRNPYFLCQILLQRLRLRWRTNG
ncbi:MAG: WecB/TagA/CpsF family glycosyltransferase, partial [Verrucomicrobia bacterium]|nr:WecB/TagA/CpsF family glycosyltransferase [Verrucomicrobiota bacterium]